MWILGCELSDMELGNAATIGHIILMLLNVKYSAEKQQLPIL
jgi:hypothetical protein